MIRSKRFFFLLKVFFRTGVLLQGVLPLLGTEQHHQLDDRIAVFEGHQSFALHEQVLAVGANQGLKKGKTRLYNTWHFFQPRDIIPWREKEQSRS